MALMSPALVAGPGPASPSSCREAEAICWATPLSIPAAPMPLRFMGTARVRSGRSSQSGGLTKDHLGTGSSGHGLKSLELSDLHRSGRGKDIGGYDVLALRQNRARSTNPAS